MGTPRPSLRSTPRRSPWRPLAPPPLPPRPVPTRRELVAYTCPQGTCMGLSYTSKHTGQVKRLKGSVSAGGPAGCEGAPRSCCCAAILQPLGSARRGGGKEEPGAGAGPGARVGRGTRAGGACRCTRLGAGSPLLSTGRWCPNLNG